MKVSLSWLQDYIALEMDPARLADCLTMAGLEVDSVQDRYAYLDSVRIGKIIEIAPHPNADALKCCRVDIGDRILEVVCGAPNVRVQMLVPVALDGTVLPNGTVLRRSVIRGRTSEAMLCSDAELGLGVDSTGIMELKTDNPLGTKLTHALHLTDTVIEIDLTPNRPDCLSIIGIAREVAAIQKSPLKLPPEIPFKTDGRIAELTSVQIEAPEHCPRYAASLVTDTRVTDSPFWLQDRLLSVGLRPINNIVDVTNFVMMECGQPLHAFDFDQLDQNRIVVRTARPGETFVTLDEKERQLSADMLMICDGTKPVAIAGVMGGLNSEIEPQTRRVLIESACFSPVSIRKTSKRLGLNTDASHRFERGVDPLGTLNALNRAARLMADASGGRIVPGIIDAHPLPSSPPEIELSIKKTNRLLGTRLAAAEINALLRSVQISVEEPVSEGGDGIKATPPSFRIDIQRPEDLMEEVARLWGYDNIDTTFPPLPGEAQSTSSAVACRERIQNLMVAFGFAETITYSFARGDIGDRLGLETDDPQRRTLTLLNPLSEDQAVLRTSVIPGLLDVIRHNLAYQNRNLKLFEIGKIFLSRGPDRLPRETQLLTAVWSGARNPATWSSPEVDCDYYDMKGVAEALVDTLGVTGVSFSGQAKPPGWARPGYTARIAVEDQPLGWCAQLAPSLLAAYGIKQAAFLMEIDLEVLLPRIPQSKFAEAIPRFPAITRDVTLIIDKDIETQRVLDHVIAMQEPLVEQIHLFAVFDGQPIPPGRTSVSFRITYRSAEKTLEDEAVNRLHKKISDRLIRQFNAGLPAE